MADNEVLKGGKGTFHLLPRTAATLITTRENEVTNRRASQAGTQTETGSARLGSKESLYSRPLVTKEKRNQGKNQFPARRDQEGERATHFRSVSAAG